VKKSKIWIERKSREKKRRRKERREKRREKIKYFFLAK